MATKAKQSGTNFPKLGKKTNVANWNDYIMVHASQVFGVRKSNIEYFLRYTDAVVAPHPPLLVNQTHSDVGGSIQEEQSLRLYHMHPIYRDNKKQFYGILGETTQGTTYEDSTKPFHRDSNGHGAYLAMIDQHAGRDKWIIIFRDAKDFFNNRMCDGTTKNILQSHIEWCRDSYVEWDTEYLHIAHSDVGGSIQEEQSLRLYHMHPIYRDNKKQFYGILGETTQGTTYEDSTKPFHRDSNGHGAYLAMIDQHAGRDKWIIIFRDAKDFFNNRMCDGTTKNILQSHIEWCRDSYVEWDTEYLHITDQVQNECTSMQSLFDYIDVCNDPKICARVAAVSNEDLGMIDNFELAVAPLLAAFPISVKVNNKSKNSQFSVVGGDLKPGIGPKTGVELCYYKPHKFFKIMEEEVAEITWLRPKRRKIGDRCEKG